MRVYLESLGCRLNYAEMFALGRQLTDAGHVVAASLEGADVCVLNSCAVTGEAARKSRQLLRQMARANPSARLVVTGCHATLEGESLAALPNVALVVGNQRKHALLELMRDFAEQGPLAEAPRAVPGERLQARTRAFVKVQDGCRNRCTFCVVTVARGDERSRAIADVVDEVRRLHADGYREAVLTGVHLGGYGHDLSPSDGSGQSLAALVRALLADTDIPRLRLSSLEPFDLAPGFPTEWSDLWAESGGRLMPHLHLPAQSGSDAVLKRMARRNTAAEFEALAAEARARIPDLTITTDLITGFPGESELHFAETVAFAERIGFAHLHVFPYSARDGTAAARFAGQVPEVERRRRSHILSELDARLGAAVRTGVVGQTRPVLWENRETAASEREDAAGMARWSGLTDNYLRVVADAPAGVDLHNRILPARLTRLEGTDLVGEMVS